MSEIFASMISTLTDSVEIMGRKIPIGILVVAGVVIGWFVLNKLKPKSGTEPTTIGNVPSAISSASNDTSNLQASIAQQLQQAKTDTATSEAALKTELTGALEGRATTLQNAIDAARTSLQAGITQNATDLSNLTKAGGTLSVLTTNVSNLLGRVTATEGVASQANTSIMKAGGILDRLSGVELKANAATSSLTDLANQVNKKGGILDRLLSSETGLSSLSTRTGVIETALNGANGIASKVSSNASALAALQARVNASDTLLSGTGGVVSRVAALETYKLQNEGQLAGVKAAYNNLLGTYNAQAKDLYGDGPTQNQGIIAQVRGTGGILERLTSLWTSIFGETGLAVKSNQTVSYNNTQSERINQLTAIVRRLAANTRVNYYEIGRIEDSEIPGNLGGQAP